MNARSPSAFILSAVLHAAVVGAVLLFTVAWHQKPREQVEVFVVVAGFGDNFGATEAPALGTPQGSPTIRVELPPAPPTPAIERVPLPPEPVAPKIERAPEPKTVTPVKAAEPTPPNFARQIERRVDRAEAKAVAQAKKQREADRKAEERRKKEAELAKQRMTVEEFQRLHGGKANASQKTPPPKSGATNVPKIDALGIERGVAGGSTSNTTGGAGGTALSRALGDALEEYLTELAARVRQAHETPPGTSEDAIVKVEITVGRDGRIGPVRIAQSSGDPAFDESALTAFRRVVMSRPPPGGKAITRVMVFRQEQG